MFALRGNGQVEMLVGQARGDASARCAVEKADLDQEGLVNLFKRIFFLGERSGEGVQADRAAIVFLNDGQQQAPVEFVEAMRIDFEHLESGLRGGAVNGAAAPDLGIIPHAAQQPVGDAGRAAGAERDLGSAVRVDGHLQHLGRTLDDIAELVLGVELEPEQDAKT